MPDEGYSSIEVVEDSIISIKNIPGKTTGGATGYCGSIPRRVRFTYAERGTGAITELNLWKSRAIDSSDYTFTLTILGQTWITGDFRVVSISNVRLVPGINDSAGAEYLHYTVELLEVVA